MGCCCSTNTQGLKNLENEILRLISEKKDLESKLIQNKKIETKASEPEFSGQSSKILPEEVTFSVEIFDFMKDFSGLDGEDLKKIHEKAQKIQTLPNNEKIAKYLELIHEEKEIMKRSWESVHKENLKFIEIINAECKDIQNRIQHLDQDLSSSDYSRSNFEEIKKDFLEIDLSESFDFSSLINKLKKLLLIEKQLTIIEKSFSLPKDQDFTENCKIIESKLSEMLKASVALSKKIESTLGKSISPEKKQIPPLPVVLIDSKSSYSLTNSLMSSLESLETFQSINSELLDNLQLQHDLVELEKTLVVHFSKSFNLKEESVSRLNRISRAKIDFTGLTLGILKQIGGQDQNLPRTVELLKEKTLKFLKTSEEHDQLLNVLTDKFSKIEYVIDEVELKIDEIIANEIKDLIKSIPSHDLASKSILDELKSEKNSQSENLSKDLSEHINALLIKLELFTKIDKLKTVVRENHAKEFIRLKSENQEKINELNNIISVKENEKSALENTLKGLKANNEKSSEILAKLMESSKDKDKEIVELKNSIASYQEELEQVKNDFDKVSDEISDLNKENRELKKSIRAKENEISELKESIGKET